MKSAKLEISPSSLSTFRQRLRQVMFQVDEEAQVGLASAADHAFAMAQANTPRVTGALASSGKVTDHSFGASLRRTISYGDSTINPVSLQPTSEYAVRVHEEMHEKHPNSYKWLERSINQYGQESFITDLAAALRRTL